MITKAQPPLTKLSLRFARQIGYGGLMSVAVAMAATSVYAQGSLFFSTVPSLSATDAQRQSAFFSVLLMWKAETVRPRC